jgi:methanethiol S-methyltransferase
MKYLFIALLWAGYCALHSYLISIRFTTLITRLLKNYYAFFRLFYIIFSFILLIPLINITSQWDNTVIVPNLYFLTIIRYVLTIISLLMFFWAFFFDYDFLSFFGIRQILNFRKTDNTNQSEIKKKGLLGIIRHPMYIALIVYLWCQTYTMTDIVVNIVLTVYIVIGTKLEEKKLILEFGDPYIKYQKEVPMLIPFIKPKGKAV